MFYVVKVKLYRTFYVLTYSYLYSTYVSESHTSIHNLNEDRIYNFDKKVKFVQRVHEKNKNRVENWISIPVEKYILKWLRSEPNFDVYRSRVNQIYINYSILRRMSSLYLYDWDTQQFFCERETDSNGNNIICVASKYSKDITIPTHLIFACHVYVDYDLSISYQTC